MNTPGHMNAILTAMEQLGLSNVRYNNSFSTIDFENTAAMDFLSSLYDKYLLWFKSMGAKFFHMGCDEYANDVLSSGFTSLQETGRYLFFIDYVNGLAKKIMTQGLTPVMFNDGMYYGTYREGEVPYSKIISAYWIKVWPGYELADVKEVAYKGHRIWNTNNKWYYVLGRANSVDSKADYTYEKSLEGMCTYKVDDISGCGKYECEGVVFSFWCDSPQCPYDEKEVRQLHTLLESFGKNVIK